MLYLFLPMKLDICCFVCIFSAKYFHVKSVLYLLHKNSPFQNLTITKIIKIVRVCMARIGTILVPLPCLL